MSEALSLPKVRGKLTQDAPLAPLVWFKAGGTADWLFEPADIDDLRAFLADLDPAVPVMPLGLGSNLIVRDGGVPGVVVRLGKPFAKVERQDETTLVCGAGASGILVSSTARDAGIAGLEFLRSIPGTVGGFVRMNGGAYGRETADILLECELVLRSGEKPLTPFEPLKGLPSTFLVSPKAEYLEVVLGAVTEAELENLVARHRDLTPQNSKTD